MQTNNEKNAKTIEMPHMVIIVWKLSNLTPSHEQRNNEQRKKKRIDINKKKKK